MRSNQVIIARLILLSSQANLHLLVLILAASSANGTRASGGPLPGAALCLILTSLAYFILVSLAGIVWCLKVPAPFISSLKFECGWTALLLIVELAATIGVTVNIAPPGNSLFAHTFLVSAAWVTVAFALIYVAALITIVMVHKPMFPRIWSASASSVDWFCHRELNADSLENDTWTRYLSDIESSGKQRFTIPDFGKPTPTPPMMEKAPWAQNIRRGVDDPFTLKAESDAASEANSFKLNAALPPLPLRVESKGVGSRFVERFRESQMITRSTKGPPTPFPQPVAPTPFPRCVDDHDMPIPLPTNRSFWIRADSVHAEPPTP
ncbi:hypothetical protein B0H17DRAFT_250101 [Mycena rosella]|uniref:Uncharacterized protein n=1 Tax=Mycena rosella TaxID=1033263 RepID=A0AAD7MC47_MYCRO|nr:hypothetical protein B0H17DRAFT_250101 [Mycena rosella]